MTDDQIVEACRDPRWRICNLYWVRDKDGKEVKFKPWPEQEKFIDNLWYRNVVPKARQRGFSTVVQILMLDACIFVPLTASAVIAQDRDTATRIFKDKITFAWSRLPKIIRDGNPLTKETESELNWDNGSSFYVATSTRGTTLQYLHISEYGKIAKTNPQRAQEIQEGSLASVDMNGVITVESTVESPDDEFSTMVKQALKIQQIGRPLAKQQYRLHFASWWDADEYRASRGDTEAAIITKEDNAYFERIEAEIGRSISKERRAWYVLKRDSDYSGENESMWSQYPSTIEEALKGSTKGRWLATQLANVRSTGRILHLPYRPDIPVDTYWDIGVSDDIVIWFAQEVDPWTDWIDYWEDSEVPYLIAVQHMQSLGYVWGRHFLPHDANHRAKGAERLLTTKDMLEQLGLRRIEIVPRTPSEENAIIHELRPAMQYYRFDAERTAAGVDHLDNFKKQWSQTHGHFINRVLDNGHQHAADALRQHAQMRHAFKSQGRPTRPKRSNRGGMAA